MQLTVFVFVGFETRNFSVSSSVLLFLLLLLCVLLAGAAAPPGGHTEGLRARGGGEGPSRHDLCGPAGGGGLDSLSGTSTDRPEAPRRLQPGGETETQTLLLKPQV